VPASNETQSSLVFIATVFGLSDAELGDLFRISRRSMSRWRAEGVPAARRNDVVEVRTLAGELARKFITERLPAIVRAKAQNPCGGGLGGRSILQAVREEGVSPVYRAIEELRVRLLCGL